VKMSRALLFLFCLGVLTLIPARAGGSKPAVGLGSVIVHSKFGGQIFLFDIDPNENEGILTESISLPGGKYLARDRDQPSRVRGNTQHEHKVTSFFLD
jgi:hypothetical protein